MFRINKLSAELLAAAAARKSYHRRQQQRRGLYPKLIHSLLFKKLGELQSLAHISVHLKLSRSIRKHGIKLAFREL